LQQIALETEELETSPEAEQKELALLYQAKGMDPKSAQDLAEKAFHTKESALDALIIEELGIDKDDLGGSAWEAAFSSFILFVTGAIIPLIPFFFTNGKSAIYFCVAGSAFGLFLIGSSITLFTGKSILFSGFRQVLFGLAAAAVTYGIGMLIGVSLAG
jgi:VIT1/CCC1 family predicted Fe2+/Mn2+ transporter